MSNVRLALISPNKDQYSETFIHFHKQKLPARVSFMYGGNLPTDAEDGSFRFRPNRWHRVQNRVFDVLLPAALNSHESRLATYFRANDVNAVLAEYGMTGAAMQKVCMKLSIPLFVHFHGYDASNRIILEQFEQRYKQMFGYASTVYAVSEKMKKALQEMGCPEKKIVLNHYGPSDIYNTAQPLFNNKRFLYVGRFVEKKAPQLLLQSFRKVLDAHPDAELQMVGKGELLEQCQQLVVDLNLQKAVTFLGVQEPREIKVLMEHSVALVQHSVTASNGDSEGTPVAVLEACAAALPVVATNHAGIPDVIIHEQSGLLCSEFDTEQMALNMIRILDDIGHAEWMGRNGRDRVHNLFTLEQHINRIYTDISSKIADQKLGSI